MRTFQLFWEGRNVKNGLLGFQEMMVGFYVHPTVVKVVRQFTPSVAHSCRPGFELYQLVLAVIGIIGTLRIARDVGEGSYNHLFGSIAYLPAVGAVVGDERYEVGDVRELVLVSASVGVVFQG